MILSPTSETPAGLMDRIRSEGESLPNLELLPPRPRDQLLAETARAAAVVCTSAWEGMPNRFLEAWARGVPVLSLSVDPDDRISEKDIGIYAGGSMDRFVEGAAALWNERGRRARDGRARPPVRPRDALARRGGRPLGRPAPRPPRGRAPMRMLQVTDYGSPFAGSFVPMLRTALDEAESRGWSAQAVLPERARERDWLADLGPHAREGPVRTAGLADRARALAGRGGGRRARAHRAALALHRVQHPGCGGGPPARRT